MLGVRMRRVWGRGRLGRLVAVGVVVAGCSMVSGSVALAATPCSGAPSSSSTQCVFNGAGQSYFTVTAGAGGACGRP